jgi:hypothetical protein
LEEDALLFCFRNGCNTDDGGGGTVGGDDDDDDETISDASFSVGEFRHAKISSMLKCKVGTHIGILPSMRRA